MANPMYGQNKADNALDLNTLKTESITGAGACSTSIPVTFLDTTGGAVAYTLAQSSVVGAVKHVIMVKDGGDGTLTIANAAGAGVVVTFAAVGDAISLINAADEDGLIIGWCMVGRESGQTNAVDAYNGPLVA